MADKRYIVNKSNYTIKKHHKSLDNSTIFVRDYMTTTNLGGWKSGTIPYGSSNFKMTVRTKSNGYRSHRYGKLVKQNKIVDESTNFGEIWTEQCVDDTTKPKDAEIKLKPNYNSLLDFAYYGSCVELIKTSISNIINNFPAELYVTNKEELYFDEELQIHRPLGGPNMVRVENPFNIDVFSESVDPNLTDINELRYFCKSKYKYQIINADGEYESCLDILLNNTTNRVCDMDGDVTGYVDLGILELYRFYRDGEEIIMCNREYAGYHIRPTNDIVDKFFESLDDFEQVLLNRNTWPLYKATFDYYHDTDFGVMTYKKDFVWPSLHGYNIDISQSEYKHYVNELLTLAEYLDERYSNNLWRMMVHESIKNLDSTVHHTDNCDNEDEIALGTSRLESFFKVESRFFDDLKRYIDNIKNTNVITYDENNNIPSYFLKDVVELSGWDVTNPTSTLSSTSKVFGLYDGYDKVYGTDEARENFYRTLKLNSEAIFSRKGTRQGIESILAMFGWCSYDFAKAKYNMKPERKKDTTNGIILQWDDLDAERQSEFYDYKIEEYVKVVSNTEDDIYDANEDMPVEYYNSLKTNELTNYSVDNTLQGLPVRLAYFQDEFGNSYKYIIPWFDSIDEIDGTPYFQMYGGWGKRNRIDIHDTDMVTNDVNALYSRSDFHLYEESIKYLHMVRSLSDLQDIRYKDLVDGDIYYVYETSDFERFYNIPFNEEVHSNYFIIKDKQNSYYFGDTFNASGDKIMGWENIPLRDVENAYGDGLKVLYLENIIDEVKGNNPHVGYGLYDNGEEYFKYFTQLFKYAIESDNFTDDAYDCNTGEVLDEIKKIGFTLSDYVMDNMKCWYFTDKYNESNAIYRLNRVRTLDGLFEEETYENAHSYKENDILHHVYVGHDNFFDSDLRPFNLETQERNSSDEAAANSVINTKRMKIIFNSPMKLDPEYHIYLNTCVLPYVKQMIPSTTILEIDVLGEETESTCLKTAKAVGISN